MTAHSSALTPLWQTLLDARLLRDLDAARAVISAGDADDSMQLAVAHLTSQSRGVAMSVWISPGPERLRSGDLCRLISSLLIAHLARN